MTKIHDNLYQFTEYLEQVDLSLHQYLLLTEEPVLVHTGTINNAGVLAPQIKQILGGKALKYILVSHFESDECGGLSALLKEFPEVVTVCSETTARQLYGFGITYSLIIKKPGECLESNGFSIECLNYPSEMHLWDGLLFFEKSRGILFSSDLVFSFGKIHGEVIEKNWPTTIATSGIDRIPNEYSREKLAADLKTIEPKFIATGHGPCVKIG